MICSYSSISAPVCLRLDMPTEVSGGGMPVLLETGFQGFLVICALCYKCKAFVPPVVLLCGLCVRFIETIGNLMFLSILVVLVVTGRTPLVRRRVWRSQCRAMTCQRWVERLGGGGWLRGAVLAGKPPDASSPFSCCVGKRQKQQTVSIIFSCINFYHAVFFKCSNYSSIHTHIHLNVLQSTMY